MPWRETLLMDQRVQFIADYQRDVFDVADLARRYGISRKTAYKWIDRYDGRRSGRAGRSVASPRAFARRRPRRRSSRRCSRCGDIIRPGAPRSS